MDLTDSLKERNLHFDEDKNLAVCQEISNISISPSASPSTPFLQKVTFSICSHVVIILPSSPHSPFSTTFIGIFILSILILSLMHNLNDTLLVFRCSWRASRTECWSLWTWVSTVSWVQLTRAWQRVMRCSGSSTRPWALSPRNSGRRYSRS